MTGFCRVDGHYYDFQWAWELRSVNGRGLELRSRLPHGFEDLDLQVRKIVTECLARGSVNMNLTLTHSGGASRLHVNEAALGDALAMIKQCQKAAVEAGIEVAMASAEGILGLRGVVEIREDSLNDDERKLLFDQLISSFDEAMKGLILARQAEGKALISVLNQQLKTAESLAGQARILSENLGEHLQEKMRNQLNDLLQDIELSEERLAQEVAILAVKSDICEELDRLDAHICAAHELLATAGPVGRKFDFLIQEFNREANTLCSKVATIDLKNIGLALKTTIDQMREQIQNLE